MIGLLFNDSPSFKTQRRYVHRVLKDFGFGRTSLEETMLDESHHLVDHLLKLENKPLDLLSIFNVSVLNILWKIVGSKR